MFAACFVACIRCNPGQAAIRQIPIDPSRAQISYTVFALGLVPITATFGRFAGTAVQDTAHPEDCHIQVTIDVNSLRMDNPDRRRQALAPDMLNAAQFPIMRFAGECAASSIVGHLTLHGVTRALTLAMQRNGPQVDCTGILVRHDFGILGMRGLVAPDVRIRLNVHLPQ